MQGEGCGRDQGKRKEIQRCGSAGEDMLVSGRRGTKAVRANARASETVGAAGSGLGPVTRHRITTQKL